MNETPFTKTLQRIAEAEEHYGEWIAPNLQADGWTGTYSLAVDQISKNIPQTKNGWDWSNILADSKSRGVELAIKVKEDGWGKWEYHPHVESVKYYIAKLKQKGIKVYDWQIINDSWAVNALERLGLEEVTSKRQERNGTLMFKDPHMVNYKTYYTFHIRTGYVRRTQHGPNPWGGGKRWTCYQLAGTKKEKIYDNFPRMVHKALRSIETYQQNNWDTLDI